MRRWVRPLLLVAGVAAVVLLARQADLTALAAWVASTGMWAPVVFGLLYAVGCLILVPAGPLTMAAGLLFGVLWGTVVVSLASTSAAVLAFTLGRTLWRDRITAWLETRPRLRRLDAAVEREGARIVFLARLSPAIPFSAVNYLFGVTRIGFWPHLWLTWIGALPGTVLYVTIGSALGDLARVRTGAPTGTAGQVAFWVGLVATLAITVVLTRLADRAMAEELDG